MPEKIICTISGCKKQAVKYMKLFEARIGYCEQHAKKSISKLFKIKQSKSYIK